MKRKQFFFILSTCLALSAYSPVSAAEATFSSFEEDETFVSEDEDSFWDENYDIIPSGNYLVIYHKGTYETSYQSYHLFLDYAKKNHLILDDIAYDESLIDELTEANPQNYITQISVKFKKEL